MKDILKKLFSPVLTVFENDDDSLICKPSHRIVLIAVGCLFSLLSLAIAFVGARGEDLTFLLPLFIFAAVGLVSLIVGCLGSDRAVAKIWGSRKL